MKKLVLLVAVMLTLSACRLGTNRQTNQPTRAPQNSTKPTSVSSPAPSPTESAPSPTTLQFQIGRNDYEEVLENVPRKYIIYVPQGYDSNHPTPVIFMFHGSNQGGQLMYEQTGWAAKADAENFIVVFPTSWIYLLTDSNKVEDKWNMLNLYQLVAPGTDLKDDVAFTRFLLDQVKATFNVDQNRIYATGFSNGGAFVQTRLILEMHEEFAAFATSGAGFFAVQIPDQLPTGINASLYAVLGTNDDKISEGTGFPLPFPFMADEIAIHPLFQPMIANTATILSLENSYTAQYEKPSYDTMTFDRSLNRAGNEYIFRMVNGMGHVYPSGNNNRAGLNVADLFWEFFQRHVKA